MKNKLKKNEKKDKKIDIGGIALTNGIIFKSPKKDSVALLDDEKINVKITRNFVSPNSKFNILEVPFIRGIYNIYSQLMSSKTDLKDNMKNICKALNVSYNENDFNINLPFFIIALLCILAIFIVVIPLTISLPFGNLKNIVQLLLQLFLFTTILVILNKNKALESLLTYHGAEHKIINAYENLNLEEINVQKVKLQSRLHKRCGSNFISFFIIITLLETIFVPIENIFFKMLLLSLLILPNISIAYELVAIISLIPKRLNFLVYPVIAIQYITTKEPSDEQIRVAIYGLRGAIVDNLDVSISEFVEKYTKENNIIIEKTDYTLKDILKVISYVTKKDLNTLYIFLNEYMLNYNMQIEITRLLDKLFKENVPLQYITKRTYFYNEQYIVNDNVLIPREDTEILVNKAIEYIEKYNLKEMIDLCTGSGCVGISIANNSNIEKVILSDISKPALEVATSNISLNNVSNKVVTKKSDLLELYVKENTITDIIVSNPPYIKTDVIPTLDKRVQKEPFIALNGGKSGLDVYIKILEQAKFVLKNNGYLIFEIGYDELNDLKNIIATHIEYEFIEAVKDYGGNDRVIICKFKENK